MRYPDVNHFEFLGNMHAKLCNMHGRWCAGATSDCWCWWCWCSTLMLMLHADASRWNRCWCVMPLQHSTQDMDMGMWACGHGAWWTSGSRICDMRHATYDMRQRQRQRQRQLRSGRWAVNVGMGMRRVQLRSRVLQCLWLWPWTLTLTVT